MSKVAVSARDLLPGTFKNDSDEEESSSMEEENENTEDVVDDLQYDVFNLLACNYHTIRILEEDDKEEVLQQQAQRAAQLLMKK